MTDDATVSPPPPSRPAGLTGGSNLDQIMPVVLFLVFYNVVDIKAAVVASTLWSVKAAVSRRRRGLGIGWWLPVITSYLIVRSAVTIMVDEEIVDFGVSSEAVYFGVGIVTKILIGLAVASTIVAGRPLLAWAVPKVLPLPPALVAEPRYLQTMATASWFIVAFEILTSVWDIWLYNNSGVNFFVVTRSGVNFVIGFVSIMGGLIYIDRRLEPLDSYPGIVDLLEQNGGPPT